MNFIKRFSLMLATICCILFSSVPVLASEVSTALNEPNSDDIMRIHTVCGNLPYHAMYSHGWGTVRLSNGTIYISHGALWQCKNCNLILVTEGDYVLGQMETIGKWATLPYPEPITSIYTDINPPQAYGSTSNNYLDGYRFFIN